MSFSRSVMAMARFTRRDVVVRTTLGIVVGYAATAAAQIALTFALAHVIARTDAVWLGTMPVLPILPGSLLYAYGARSATRASLVLLSTSAVLAGVRWVL